MSATRKKKIRNGEGELQRFMLAGLRQKMCTTCITAEARSLKLDEATIRLTVRLSAVEMVVRMVRFARRHKMKGLVGPAAWSRLAGHVAQFVPRASPLCRGGKCPETPAYPRRGQVPGPEPTIFPETSDLPLTVGCQVFNDTTLFDKPPGSFRDKHNMAIQPSQHAGLTAAAAGPQQGVAMPCSVASTFLSPSSSFSSSPSRVSSVSRFAHPPPQCFPEVFTLSALEAQPYHSGSLWHNGRPVQRSLTT
jgi:hypothetical protein